MTALKVRTRPNSRRRLEFARLSTLASPTPALPMRLLLTMTVVNIQATHRAKELLKLVGLEERMHHEPSQLSGGQQQRVAIARALVNRPSVLFADEPTGNLDSHTSEEVLRMFHELNKHESITLILVTHDPGIARHAQRVIRIHDGVIVDGALQKEASLVAEDASEAEWPSEGGTT